MLGNMIYFQGYSLISDSLHQQLQILAGDNFQIQASNRGSAKSVREFVRKYKRA